MGGKVSPVAQRVEDWVESGVEVAAPQQNLFSLIFKI